MRMVAASSSPAMMSRRECMPRYSRQLHTSTRLNLDKCNEFLVNKLKLCTHTPMMTLSSQ